MPPASQRNPAIVAIMGATGTGKSTFIKHVTGQTRILIGHKPDSETFNVDAYSYTDPYTRTPAILVDTPGFDDSREGVTDTDILEKIATFLQKDAQKINGIIYMFRISDVRMGGMSRKNLRMFKELCGSDRLSNVRIVSTNWDRVSSEEGTEREADLAQGPFKSLLDAGAKMARQDSGKASALSIMSELIHQRPVMLRITEEMNYGIPLGETSAGRIIVEEIAKLQKKHEEEMMELRRELEQAAEARNNALSAELVAEQKALQEKMERAASDRRKLQEMRLEQLQKTVEENVYERAPVGKRTEGSQSRERVYSSSAEQRERGINSKSRSSRVSVAPGNERYKPQRVSSLRNRPENSEREILQRLLNEEQEKVRYLEAERDRERSETIKRERLWGQMLAEEQELRRILTLERDRDRREAIAREQALERRLVQAQKRTRAYRAESKVDQCVIS